MSTTTNKAVSNGEVSDLKMVFKKFDANGNNKISLSELRDILRALGTEMPADELKSVMKDIDSDGDGFIDLDEFTAFYSGSDGNGESGNEEPQSNQANDVPYHHDGFPYHHIFTLVDLENESGEIHKGRDKKMSLDGEVGAGGRTANEPHKERAAIVGFTLMFGAFVRLGAMVVKWQKRPN